MVFDKPIVFDKSIKSNMFFIKVLTTKVEDIVSSAPVVLSVKLSTIKKSIAY